jgi:hypothetical protein
MGKVNANFTYDGKRLQKGSVNVEIADVTVREEEIPKAFLFMLLDEETSKRAWQLYDMVGGIIHRKIAREYLFTLAYDKGLDAAFELAKKFKQEWPRGKARFYFEPNYLMNPDISRVELTDGETAFSFPCLPFEPAELPVNPYAETEYTPHTLSVETYLKAECCADEFFEFTKRLMASRLSVRETTIEETFNLFFTDRAKAHRQLIEIERKFAYVQERNSACNQLNREAIVPFAAGYLIVGSSYPQPYYYVTTVGDVFKLNYNNTTDTKKAIEKAINHGVTPKKIVPIRDKESLGEIATIVGKLRPDLTLVIAP